MSKPINERKEPRYTKNANEPISKKDCTCRGATIDLSQRPYHKDHTSLQKSCTDYYEPPLGTTFTA